MSTKRCEEEKEEEEVCDEWWLFCLIFQYFDRVKGHTNAYKHTIYRTNGWQRRRNQDQLLLLCVVAVADDGSVTHTHTHTDTLTHSVIHTIQKEEEEESGRSGVVCVRENELTIVRERERVVGGAETPNTNRGRNLWTCSHTQSGAHAHEKKKKKSRRVLCTLRIYCACVVKESCDSRTNDCGLCYFFWF